MLSSGGIVAAIFVVASLGTWSVAGADVGGVGACDAETAAWNSEAAFPDPAKDGWNTEVLGSKAQKALAGLLKATFETGREAADFEFLEAGASGTVRVDPLRPERLVTVFERDGLVVRRAAPEAGKREAREGPRTAPETRVGACAGRGRGRTPGPTGVR